MPVLDGDGWLTEAPRIQSSSHQGKREFLFTYTKVLKLRVLHHIMLFYEIGFLKLIGFIFLDVLQRSKIIFFTNRISNKFNDLS